MELKNIGTSKQKTNSCTDLKRGGEAETKTHKVQIAPPMKALECPRGDSQKEVH